MANSLKNTRPSGRGEVSIIAINKFCEHGPDVVPAILLHNAMSYPDNQVDILNTEGVDQRLFELADVFPDRRIICPSGILNGNRFINFSLGNHHFYGYLEGYFPKKKKG